MLAFYPEDTASGPAYFILLRFDGDELHLIREVLDPRGFRKAEFGG